jgi:pectate lyase
MEIKKYNINQYPKSIGFAGLYNNGKGVTGGGNGDFYEFDDFDKILSDIKNVGNTPKNYLYTGGDINIADYRSISSNNKTIMSTGNQTIYKMNLRIIGVQNIIWRNWKHFDTINDQITIKGTTKGVSIEFCDFDQNNFSTTGIQDSCIDITQDAEFVTIRNCNFKNGNRCHLVSKGSSNEYPAGNKITITFVYNSYFNFIQRVPRGSWSDVHVLNCFFDNSLPLPDGTMKTIDSANSAQFYVQGNYFNRGKRLFDDSGGSVKLDNNFIGDYQSRTVAVRPKGVLWNPNDLNGYNFHLFTPELAKIYVEENAGVTVYNIDDKPHPEPEPKPEPNPQPEPEPNPEPIPNPKPENHPSNQKGNNGKGKKK